MQIIIQLLPCDITSSTTHIAGKVFQPRGPLSRNIRRGAQCSHAAQATLRWPPTSARRTDHRSVPSAPPLPTRRATWN